MNRPIHNTCMEGPCGRGRPILSILLVVLTATLAAGCVSADRDGDDKQRLRVVSLLPSLSEVVVAVAGADVLVGICDYCPVQPQKGRPRLGGISPDTDGILAARPDLVPADASQARALWPVLGAGIHVETLPATAAPTVEARLAVAERAASSLGRPEAGRRFTESLRSRIGSVQRAVAGRPRPTVVYISRWEPLRIAAGDYVEQDIIHLAGGRNLGSHLPGSSEEIEDGTLHELDPDILLVAQKADIETAQRRWPDLRAVEAARVCALDLRHHRDPPRRHWAPMAENIEQLAAILHPDAVAPRKP